MGISKTRLKRNWAVLLVCLVPGSLAMLMFGHSNTSYATDMNSACVYSVYPNPSDACAAAEKRLHYTGIPGSTSRHWVFCVTCATPCPGTTDLEATLPNDCSIRLINGPANCTQCLNP